MGGITIFILGVVEQNIQNNSIPWFQVLASGVSLIGGVLSLFNIAKSLGERRNYSRQIKSLFVQILTYSLATNEQLLNTLHNSNNPAKTYEIYLHELESMKRNLSLILPVDLSKVSRVYQNNIQGYIYQYGKFINTAEEYLIRLKNKSDHNKEILQEKHNGKRIKINSESFSSDEGETPEEIVASLIKNEYGVDYLVVEQESKTKNSFISSLIDLRYVLQEMLESTERKKYSKQTDIQSVYHDFLAKNQVFEKNKL